jgi:fructose-bisphosphate aldolase, class I
MDEKNLEQTAKQMIFTGKGLLAADESDKTCKKRFDSVGVECTDETRRDYRGLLFTTPDAEKFLSGVILFDETFQQATNDGKLFRDYLKEKDILPGIKVDKGLIDLPGFPGEKVSQGLDGLPERMAEYAKNGAKFAKWRSVIAIGDGLPTDICIKANAYVLSRYARICQEVGIVPIVEPEVLFDGNHTIGQCEEAMAKTFRTLFEYMKAFRVHMPGAILKTSMVLPGKDSGTPIDHDDVAERTVRVLHDHVPHDLGGVVFLSGGQTSNDAIINLNRIAKKGPHPWGVTFSYSRALQDAVLKAWAKNRNDKEAVQKLFAQQLEFAGKASKGELDESQLHNDDFVTKSQDL